ncbi:MAG: macro domain-containing protein [Bradymonadaceae bacterium]|nr:macro domain-containing protein [Lujinxingiaceae bacterium]
MIESTSGNLLNAEVDALVNTINCVGVMGKGIALQFKQAFPEMFEAYRKASKAGEVVPGKMYIYATGSLLGPKFIVNFPTKRHWKGKSRLEDIDAGLVDLVRQVHELGIRSIAIPPLGSGNGGLDWSVVRPRIVEAFESLPDVRVLLYEPKGEPQGEDRRIAPTKEKLTTARALFIRLLDLYTIPSYELTLLEVQKLAYFLQEAGQPLRLQFARHHYGPYAHNLNHVLRRLEGHYLHGATDVKPSTEIKLVAGINEEATNFLADDAQANARLDRVAELIHGFETPYGMELLATVHWVAQEDGAAIEDIDHCVNLIHAWSNRKRQVLRQDHIRVAHHALKRHGWFDPAPASLAGR